MKVLVINCGSSSLKYQLIDSDTEAVIAKDCVRGSVSTESSHIRPWVRISIQWMPLCRIACPRGNMHSLRAFPRRYSRIALQDGSAQAHILPSLREVPSLYAVQTDSSARSLSYPQTSDSLPLFSRIFHVPLFAQACHEFHDVTGIF